MPVQSVAAVAAWLGHVDCLLNGECIVISGRRLSRYFLGETRGVTFDTVSAEGIAENMAAAMDDRNYAVWPDTLSSLAAAAGEDFVNLTQVSAKTGDWRK
jgi:hypothetical protein